MCLFSLNSVFKRWHNLCSYDMGAFCLVNVMLVYILWTINHIPLIWICPHCSSVIAQRIKNNNKKKNKETKIKEYRLSFYIHTFIINHYVVNRSNLKHILGKHWKNQRTIFWLLRMLWYTAFQAPALSNPVLHYL